MSIKEPSNMFANHPRVFSVFVCIRMHVYIRTINLHIWGHLHTYTIYENVSSMAIPPRSVFVQVVVTTMMVVKW